MGTLQSKQFEVSSFKRSSDKRLANLRGILRKQTTKIKLEAVPHKQAISTKVRCAR